MFQRLEQFARKTCDTCGTNGGCRKLATDIGTGVEQPHFAGVSVRSNL
jgi:hypothetical protein